MNSNQKELVPFPVIRKRDGRLSRFDLEKISEAIYKAFFAIGIDNPERCDELSQMVVKELLETSDGRVPQVEEIQDSVERVLIRERHEQAAKNYILYRARRTNIREGKSQLMDSVETILAETHKDSNYRVNSPGVKMLKIASAASRRLYLTRIIPSQFAEAHNRGDIHIHDLEYYAKTIHSLQIPLGRMLKTGFSSGYGFIRPPKYMSSVGALTAIIIQSCQNDMHGGQSIPAFDRQISYYLEKEPDRRETFQAMQGLVYNLNMMYSRMGEQVPTSTINLGLDTSPTGRLVTEALLNALEEGLGKGETPIYPWIVFHIKDGVNFKEGDPNYDLLQKAVRVACRRMNPTFAFADSPVNSKSGQFAYWGDGSRSATDFPVPEFVEKGEGLSNVEGWGAIARVTINLPRVAFRIAHKRKDFLVKSYYNEIRRILELCVRQLIHRRDVLSGLKAGELPFVMGEKVYRGTGEIGLNDPIDRALGNGVLSIGFVGLAESLFILFGKSFGRDEKTLDFALDIIDFMNKTTRDLSEEFEAPFIIDASSSGYAAGRFHILDRTEFSIAPNVNDKSYYTQGAGIQVNEDIPWEERLEIEAKFHNRIPGGHFTFLKSKQMPKPEKYMEVLGKMKDGGIAYGGISYDLKESLEDGSIVTDKYEGRARHIHRAAGLLLPRDRINEGLLDELRRNKIEIL